jgi:hypothetical protein
MWQFGTGRFRRAVWPVLALIVLASVSGRPMMLRAGQKVDNKKCPGYYIVSHYVELDERTINILLNAEYFTEERLVKLGTELLSSYPTPKSLVIDVYSDLDQVKWFVNARPQHPNEQFRELVDPIKPWNKYAKAYIFRDQRGDEILRYNFPGEDRVTVVLRGKDPGIWK